MSLKDTGSGNAGSCVFNYSIEKSYSKISSAVLRILFMAPTHAI